MILMSSDFNLEQRNFENLCYMHKDTLLKIQHGKSAYKLLSCKKRNQLCEAGVLKIRYGYFLLSEKAELELLRELEEK